jgi:predicted dehydrogenase
MYRHHPQTKIVGEWVRNGRLGDIILVRSTFQFPLENPNNVRLVPEYGGGSLWDVGVYPMSFAQYIMGEPPQWVIGDQWIGRQGTEESFSGQLHYGEDGSGRVAQISSAFRAPFYTWAEILGTKGRLTLSRPFTNLENDSRQLLFHYPDDRVEEIPVPQKELYLGEVEDMHNAILDNQPQYLTLAETRNHIKTILALYESAAQKQICRLAD